eukprot:scaffold63366_cov42-Phaeocystis_antarctica.AAC.1
MSVPTMVLISPDGFASLTSRVARCEHGRMFRHDPEPTAAIAATSGRPCGLHTTASHTGGMVAPSDPGARAAQIRDFIFGQWDSLTVEHAPGPGGESRHKPDR